MTKGHFKAVVASIAASLMLTISGIFGVSPASAYDFDTYLLISPASQTLGKLEPGNTYKGEFMVKNIGNEALGYKVYVAPYYVQNEDYDPTYDTNNTYTRISEWFSFSKTSGSLKPQQEETVSYTVKVPSDAPGGAQNAAIMVETDNSVTENAVVSATSRLAMIVYSQVNGETNICGKILDKTIPSLLLNPPITASARVENCGNIDLNVRYKMSIYPLFSNEPVYTNEETPTTLATLPETRRYTALVWEGTPSFGLYRVNFNVRYADKDETVEKLVLVCPLWLIVLIIVFIGALIFWLVSRSRGRKKSKKAVEE